MTAYATLADLEARHPAELIKLAADETTGVRDDGRIDLALTDASGEVRTILKGRYSVEDLGRIDDESRATLKLYTMDIALYRIALAFSRSNDRIEKRYDTAVKRLEAIASGKSGLTFEGSDQAGSEVDGGAAIAPNEVVMDAPDRIFTRDRTRGL